MPSPTVCHVLRFLERTDRGGTLPPLAARPPAGTFRVQELSLSHVTLLSHTAGTASQRIRSSGSAVFIPLPPATPSALHASARIVPNSALLSQFAGLARHLHRSRLRGGCDRGAHSVRSRSLSFDFVSTPSHPTYRDWNPLSSLTCLVPWKRFFFRNFFFPIELKFSAETALRADKHHAKRQSRCWRQKDFIPDSVFGKATLRKNFDRKMKVLGSS